MSEIQPWKVLVHAIRELESEAVSRIVPLPDWVHELRQFTHSNSTDITELPALR